jgi:ubiquitin carboxyl-terminal hydrolase 36/42
MRLLSHRLPAPYAPHPGTQVLCTVCKHASNRYEAVLDLQLHITDDAITCIESALAHYVAAEVLDGDNLYQCDKCEHAGRPSKVEARRALTIHVAPNVLMLQVPAPVHSADA